MKFHLILNRDAKLAFVKAAKLVESMQWFEQYHLILEGWALNGHRPFRSELGTTDPRIDRYDFEVQSEGREMSLEELNMNLLELCRVLRRHTHDHEVFLPKDILLMPCGMITLNGQKMLYRDPEEILKELEAETGQLWTLWWDTRHYDEYWRYSDDAGVARRQMAIEEKMKEMSKNPPDPDMLETFKVHVMRLPNAKTSTSLLDAAKMFKYI